MISSTMTLCRRADVDDEIENETMIELGQPTVPRDHVRLPLIADCLPCLERLSITYGVRRCGLNFNWNIFQFTLKVCAARRHSLGGATVRGPEHFVTARAMLSAVLAPVSYTHLTLPTKRIV